MAPWSDAYPLHSVPWLPPEQPITNGFDAWAAVSKFTFERVREESRAVLRVTFGHRDGPGGTLGSAAPSYTDATIILDEDDSWTVGAVPGSHDLETVVTHEIGHILGLAHSQYKEALMYALIDDGVIKKLAQDDIDGIRVRYSWSIGYQLLFLGNILRLCLVPGKC